MRGMTARFKAPPSTSLRSTVHSCSAFCKVGKGTLAPCPPSRPANTMVGTQALCLPYSYSSGDQLGEQIRVDIATGEDDDDVLALDVDPAGEQGGETDGAAGLDHELQLAIGERNRGADFRVGGRHALCQQLAVDRKRHLAG